MFSFISMSSSDPSSTLYTTPTTQSMERARLLGTIISTWSLMLIIVSLRFVARRLSKAGLEYDDWLIIPATLSATTCFASAIWMTQQGLGRSIYILSPDQLSKFLKGILISAIGWAIAICIIKCSILAFYWRLFSSQGRSFRIAVWVSVAVMINWGIAVAAATVFQSSPKHRNWSEGRCLSNTYWFFVGSFILHIITDVALICLPMPVIWKLQMSRSRKAILTFVFGLGGFVTIVAFVRLVYLLKADAEPANVAINLINILIWTGVEVNMSLVCACLPSLRPIATLISDKYKRLHKRKSTYEDSILPLDAGRPNNAPIVSPSSTKHRCDSGHFSISSSLSELE